MLSNVTNRVPGMYIQEQLDAREWSQRDLAFILGIEEAALNKIIKGKTGISIEMSKALAEAFDIDADFFSNLQKAYDLANSAMPDPSLLAGEEDPELVIGRRVVAAVALVGEDARNGAADQRLHVRDHGCQGVAVIGIAGSAFTWVTNWPPLAWPIEVATETLTPNS
jgi:addiction module HigA family antidote